MSNRVLLEAVLETLDALPDVKVPTSKKDRTVFENTKEMAETIRHSLAEEDHEGLTEDEAEHRMILRRSGLKYW